MPVEMKALSDDELVQCCVLFRIPVGKGGTEWERYLQETRDLVSRLAHPLGLSGAQLARLTSSEKEMLQYVHQAFPDAWSEVFRRYKGLVCAVSMRSGIRTDRLETMVSVVFGDWLPRALKRFNPGRRLAPFLANVARNACMDELRRNKANWEGMDSS